MALFAEEHETRVVLDSRDQNDFRITRQDPSGYFIISREKGTTPLELRGFYTRKEVAISAIKNYLEHFSLPRPIKEIKTITKKV